MQTCRERERGIVKEKKKWPPRRRRPVPTDRSNGPCSAGHSLRTSSAAAASMRPFSRRSASVCSASTRSASRPAAASASSLSRRRADWSEGRKRARAWGGGAVHERHIGNGLEARTLGLETPPPRCSPTTWRTAHSASLSGAPRLSALARLGSPPAHLTVGQGAPPAALGLEQRRLAVLERPPRHLAHRHRRPLRALLVLPPQRRGVLLGAP